MTRKEALSKWRDEVTDLSDYYELINKIYDGLEAQLKAKDEDLKLAMDLSEHMLDELKTERGIKEYLAKELKAKDEEIKGLGCRIYHAEGYISDLHNNPKDKKFYYKKARSIVAMLFWEWRDIKDCTNRDCAEATFRKAYKMLKKE